MYQVNRSNWKMRQAGQPSSPIFLVIFQVRRPRTKMNATMNLLLTKIDSWMSNKLPNGTRQML